MQEIYENQRYVVKVAKDANKYYIVNKETSIKEDETTMLPQAINMCNILDTTLEAIEEHPGKTFQDLVNENDPNTNGPTLN